MKSTYDDGYEKALNEVFIEVCGNEPIEKIVKDIADKQGVSLNQRIWSPEFIKQGIFVKARGDGSDQAALNTLFIIVKDGSTDFKCVPMSGKTMPEMVLIAYDGARLARHLNKHEFVPVGITEVKYLLGLRKDADPLAHTAERFRITGDQSSLVKMMERVGRDSSIVHRNKLLNLNLLYKEFAEELMTNYATVTCVDVGGENVQA